MNSERSNYSNSDTSPLDDFLTRMRVKYPIIPEASGLLREHVIGQFLVVMAHEEYLRGENGPISQDWYELCRLAEMKRPKSISKKVSIFDTL